MNIVMVISGIVLSMVGVSIIEYANHMIDGVRIIVTTIAGFALFVIGAFTIYFGM